MSFGSPYASQGHLGSSWGPASWATPLGGSFGVRSAGAGYSPHMYTPRGPYSGPSDRDILSPASNVHRPAYVSSADDATPIASGGMDESVWNALPDDPFTTKDTPGREIMEAYWAGQLSSVCRAGVWWTVFSAVVLAIFNGKTLSIGGVRVAFNTAMFFLSPLAGAWGERTSIRLVLMKMTSLRGLVYCVLLPALWALLATDWIVHHQDWMFTVFGVCFFSLIFCDGVCVAFSNVVDMDCGGLDLVASQYGATLDMATRRRFHSYHDLVFNAAIIVAAPALAGFMYWASEHWPEHRNASAMLGTLAVFFFITTLSSFFSYWYRMPALVVTHRKTRILPSSAEAWDIWFSIAEGLKLCWKFSSLRWRVLFLALETSLEDAIVSLIVVEMSVRCFAEGKYALGGLYAAGLVSVGKFAGVLGGFVTQCCWSLPEDPESAQVTAYRPLVPVAFASSCCVLLLPLSVQLHEQHALLGVVVGFIAVFLHFLLSAAPKIGFGSLLQLLASRTESSGRVFGFVAAFLTAVDSIVMICLSAIFAHLCLQTALWVSCGIIVFVAFLQLLAGEGTGTDDSQSERVPLDISSGANSKSYTFIQ